ncbi:hypothetical protein CYMTET_17277 [Cymbomonas tetramitiformis]|uniref:Uncharacterized protein n=1 Tax=Cymbomonas tetramitiformis TaxID=36881 RepID=A0AAE0GAL8_9CHLO|nr:hypothetical protein CYMTET_17277 [Cymbomonas tetramitiformis]
MKPAKERRPLPKPPQEIPDRVIGGKGGSKAVDEFNERMYEQWETQSLITCQHCGRSFRDEAMRHHRKSCTAANPAKPAGTGLTRQSLSVRMGKSPVSGSNHDMSHLRATFDSGNLLFTIHCT